MSLSAAEAYTQVVQRLTEQPDVTQSQKKGFGAGLRVGGQVFAMLVRSQLVVKLPRHRIDALLATGQGEPYVSGERAMNGWVMVAETTLWCALADEARSFVAAPA